MGEKKIKSQICCGVCGSAVAEKSSDVIYMRCQNRLIALIAQNFFLFGSDICRRKKGVWREHAGAL